MTRGKTTFLTALLVLLAPAAAYAQYDCLLPNSDSMYLGKDTITYGPSAQNMLFFASPGLCVPIPPLGSPTTTSFGGEGDIRVSGDGGVTWGEYGCQATMTVQLTTTAESGIEEMTQAELLQMDFSGGHLPAGMLLRESPTLSSTGQVLSYSSSPFSGFFDVFTELSTDGGQTWIPASGSDHLDFIGGVPTRQTTWGAVRATYR
jgi:hypothetical protein